METFTHDPIFVFHFGTVFYRSTEVSLKYVKAFESLKNHVSDWAFLRFKKCSSDLIF